MSSFLSWVVERAMPSGCSAATVSEQDVPTTTKTINGGTAMTMLAAQGAIFSVGMIPASFSTAI